MWTSGQFTRIFALNGAILVMLLVGTLNAEPSCDELLKPLDPTKVEPKIIWKDWILKDAYSTDTIDQFTLRHLKNSWARFFSNDRGFNAIMGHMIAWPGRSCSECCVYHHFHNMFLGGNDTVIMHLHEFNSTAIMRFLKNCDDDCLTLTINAHVPDYAPLTYLLVYGLKGKLNEIDEQRVKQQAACLKLHPRAPFYYHGNGTEFCPDEKNTDSPYDASFPDTAHLLSSWYGIQIPEDGHGQ